jgi:hypothetical protein
MNLKSINKYVYFIITHWKIRLIGTLLHYSFAGRMWPAGRNLETPGLENVGALMSDNPMGVQCKIAFIFTGTLTEL